MTPQEAIAALWVAGDLSYKLHETQERMRDAIIACAALLFVLNCARRLGKSYLCCVLAIEMCLQKSRARVVYIAPTAKQVRTIITPLMREILADAPPHFVPDFNGMDGIWRFPHNGSEIHIVGVNNGHADDARGGDADLVIIDEAGQVDDLVYLVESIIKPMLLVTNGRIVMPSTPAPTPAHPFTDYCAKATIANAYAEFTLLDAPHIPAERVEAFIAEGGGRGATAVRREYFCEHVVDDSVAVLPEFSRCKSTIVADFVTPAHFVPIIVGDAGFHDFTFVLGGYHDFANAVDCWEWEYVGAKKLAREIDASVTKEATNAWGADRAARRFIDAPPQIVAEMNANASAYQWSGIAKKETDGPFMGAAVNAVRQRMTPPISMRIHPRCTNLIAHCQYAVWRVPGKDFERMDGFGHFDGVAALAYGTRLIDRVTNPTPIRVPTFDQIRWSPPESERDNLRALARRARA